MKITLAVIAILALSVSALFNIEVTAAAWTATPALYGNNAYHPLIRDDVVHISTPSGALVSRDDGIKYVITDHLGSGRVARDTDVSDHGEYGPFGTPVAGDVALYNDKVFDNASETYDYVARWYDPTLGAFLSADPGRRGANPYSYANLNPTNLVDPDGRAPIHFFFYSKYGTEVPDSTGLTSIRRHMLSLSTHSRTSPATVVVAVLENDAPIVLPEGELSNSHFTIISHGLPGSFSVIDPGTGRRVRVSGGEFSGYLYDRMFRMFGDDVGRVAGGARSMSVLSCFGACRRPADTRLPNSFAEEFANTARLYFPNLESITASPYEISTGPSLGRMRADEFNLGVARDTGSQERLNRYMSMESFFSGQYPADLYGPFSGTEFGSVSRWWSVTQSDGTVRRQYGTSHLELSVREYVGAHIQEFREPVLYRIPIASQPAVPPPPNFPPPVLPEE